MATVSMRPTMYMLAGPNGAGKSTLYETVIQPRIKAPFINADLIQKNELHDPSMSASYEAARIAGQRRQSHLKNKESFVSESTFSHPSKLSLIDEAKAAGFRIVIFHINVRSADLSVARVATRVERGGHDVPEDKIRARYDRNQALIRQAALRADKAFVYDNSVLGTPPLLVMSFSHGRIDRLADEVPAWVRTLYAKEISESRVRIRGR